MLPGKEMPCSRPQCSSPNGGDTSRIAMSLCASLACWQCGSRTEAPPNGLKKYHRRERTDGRTNPHSLKFYNRYYIYVWCSWGCGVGVCGSAVVPCCGVWVALELSCLATLLSLELEGSRDAILYDEIYIMIIEK